MHCLLTGKTHTALHLFIIMGLSDALDGWLAKRYGWCSPLGSFLDPLADKLMLVSALVALAWLNLLPIWFISLAVARDVIIGSGYLWLRYCNGAGLQAISPSLSSKLNTVLQVALVLAVLVQLDTALPDSWIRVLMSAAFFSIVVSGVGYATIFYQNYSRRTRRSFSRMA